MTYVVVKSDGTTLVEVTNETINTSATSLDLVGRGATNYGLSFARNFVRLAENFAHSVAPSNPLRGQVWYDTGSGTLKTWSGSAWISQPRTINGIAPDSSGNVDLGGSGTTFSITVGSDTVTLLLADNLVIGAVSHNAIVNGSLPVSVLIGVTTYQVRSRFPSGLVAGITLATDGNNYVFAGTATSARYADLAERYAASETLEPGDLVMLGGPAEIQKTRTINTPDVFGVISAEPAFRMNDAAGTDATHPFVALSGRVRVKTTGRVLKGQRMVASLIAGVAQAADDDADIHSIFGRALEAKDTDDVGMVEVVVGVK